MNGITDWTKNELRIGQYVKVIDEDFHGRMVRWSTGDAVVRSDENPDEIMICSKRDLVAWPEPDFLWHAAIKGS